MITVTPALHLLVALAMAAPTSTPSACAADDLHCSAPAFAAKAQRAESDEERVEYLYFATRAYLALADQPPKGHVLSRDLCQAKLLIEQALALPATELRKRVVESRRETLARLTEQKVQCKRSKPAKPRELPTVALAGDATTDNAEPPAKLLASAGSNPTPSPTIIVEDSQTTTPPVAEAVAEGPTQRPVLTTPASPIEPMTTPTDRTPSESLASRELQPSRQPGRRLLIFGGVSLTAGLALTSVAAYTGAQALDARRTGHESMQLAATSDNLARNMRLEEEYRRLGPIAVATGVAGGAAVVAAIVMLCVGARRKARAADSEPILMPVRTGVLFTLKF